MPAVKSSSPTARLAFRIERDIRSRGLSPGDPYLTAQEAADLFGVSRTTCNRALHLLAERNVVNRRRNSGTFVGPNVQSQASTLVRSVYVLMSSDRPIRESLRNALINSVWSELPDVDLHFARLPAGNEVRYSKELLHSAAERGQLTGVIAASCPLDVLQLLSQQKAPVVVIGSVDPTNDKLASVDGDERQAGQLLAQHMLGQGHKQFAVLMSEMWRSGDHLFLDGVQRVLQDARLSIGALCVRGIPDNPHVFRQQVRQLLGEVNGKLAVICQNPSFASLFEQMQHDEPELQWSRVAIAFNADTQLPQPAPQYPCSYQQDSDANMTAQVVNMLIQLSQGTEPPTRHVVLPMAMFVPFK